MLQLTAAAPSEHRADGTDARFRRRQQFLYLSVGDFILDGKHLYARLFPRKEPGNKKNRVAEARNPFAVRTQPFASDG